MYSGALKQGARKVPSLIEAVAGQAGRTIASAGEAAGTTAAGAAKQISKRNAALAAITGQGGPSAPTFKSLTGQHTFQNLARQGRPIESNIAAREAILGLSPLNEASLVAGRARGQSPSRVAELAGAARKGRPIESNIGAQNAILGNNTITSVPALPKGTLSGFSLGGPGLPQIPIRRRGINVIPEGKVNAAKKTFETGKQQKGETSLFSKLAGPGATNALIAEQMAKYKSLANQLAEVKERLQASEARVQEAESNALMKNTMIANLQRQIANASNKNAKIVSLEQQIANIRTSAEAAQSSEVARVRSQLEAEKEAAVAAIRAEYEQQLQQLEATLVGRSTANSATKNAALRNLRSEMNTRIREAEAAKQAEIEAAVAGAQQQMKTSFEAQLAEARGEIDPVRTQLGEAEERIQQLTRNLNAARQRSNALNATTRARNNALQQVEGLTAQLAAAKEEAGQLSNARTRIQQLTADLAQAEGRATELNATRANRNAARQQVEQLTQELTAVRQNMQSRLGELETRTQNVGRLKSNLASARLQAANAAKESMQLQIQLPRLKAEAEAELAETKQQLEAALKEAREAKEFAEKSKDESIAELIRKRDAHEEELSQSYQTEIEAAKQEAEALRRAIKTSNESSKLQSELDAARRYISELQSSKNAEIERLKRASREELARAKAEYDALLARARKNVENARTARSENLRKAQEEVAAARKAAEQAAKEAEAKARVEAAAAEARAAAEAALRKGPLVAAGIREQMMPNGKKPGLLGQKIGKIQSYQENPIIRGNIQKELEKVDTIQDLFIITDSISCRDLSTLISDNKPGMNAHRAEEEGRAPTLSDIGIQLALQTRNELRNNHMDHVLIAPIYKTIQTAVLLFGTKDQIILMFPTLESSRSSIADRFQFPKMYVIEAASIPFPDTGVRRGLFSKDPRDPSSDRILINELKEAVPGEIDFSYLQKIPINYSYNRLMEITKNIVRNTIEDKTYDMGHFALILQPNIVRNIYNEHITNKSDFKIAEEQPYFCEVWKTTFDLASEDKSVTLKEIILPPNQIKPASLSIDNIWSYGRRCKWTYKAPLHGTKKRGGYRRRVTRRGRR